MAGLASRAHGLPRVSVPGSTMAHPSSVPRSPRPMMVELEHAVRDDEAQKTSAMMPFSMASPRSPR